MENILHKISLRKTRDLGNKSYTFVGVNIDLTVVIVHFSGEYSQECRFSAAVSAKDSNTLPLLNFKGQTIQEVFSDYKEFYKVFYRYINHCLSPKLPPQSLIRPVNTAY